MELILISLVFILLGGALYMIRGGGFGDQYSDIATWLTNHGLPSIRNLYIVSFILLPLIAALYLSINGIYGYYLLELIVALAMGYALTFMWNWGTYYNMGTNNLYYQNHRGILWIDWILYKLFGPEWIPVNAVDSDPVDFDLVSSSTGGPNTYDWLRKRSMVGMALRMFYSIILFALIGFVKYYNFHNLHSLIITDMMALPFMLTSLIYAFFVTPSKLVSEALNPWRFQQPIGKSELVTGMWLHLLLVIAIFV